MGKRFVRFRRFAIATLVKVVRICMCCLVMMGNRIIWFRRLAREKGLILSAGKPERMKVCF